jgi:hypothetical protein
VPRFLDHRVPELLDEVVAMYRAAGRPLAALTDGDLDAHFVDTVEAYIADPRNPARFRAVNNVAAEYVLRGGEAPVTRVMRLKEGKEIEGNQPDKPKLCIFIFAGGDPKDLPMVVLAFGCHAVIPALGAIAYPEGSEERPTSWDKNLSEVELEHAKERWRKERDARSAEFDWLLGLSAPHSERDRQP